MKKAIFTLIDGGGSYHVKIVGDDKKENWGKINGTTVFDYQKKAIENDLKNDKYKIITQ